MAEIEIKPLVGRYSGDTLALVCNVFCTASPLHHALGISSNAFKQYLSPDWLNYSMRGPVPSLVAVHAHSDEVVGCLIPAAFPTLFDSIASLPAPQRKIYGLLQMLEDRFLQSSPELARSFLVDIAVVSPEFEKQGIYRQLRQAIHESGKNSGYHKVYGELSATATQHVCREHFGHRVVAEVAYAEFDLEGSRPFETIKEPPSIQLVEGIL